MKKAIFILVAIMLVTFSCKDDEVEIERACYEFTTAITVRSKMSYSSQIAETKNTGSTIICDLTSSDASAIASSTLYSGTTTEETEISGITFTTTTSKLTTYKKLKY